jgi:hypothetical protein
MTRISLSKDQADYIAWRIEVVSQDGSRTAPYAAHFKALPLFPGWSETFAIRADGLLVRWSNEGDYEGWRDLEEPRDVRTSLTEGARRDPGLAFLLPPRPPGARTCPNCHGVGFFFTPHSDYPFFCDCGGLGWVDG